METDSLRVYSSSVTVFTQATCLEYLHDSCSQNRYNGRSNYNPWYLEIWRKWRGRGSATSTKIVLSETMRKKIPFPILHYLDLSNVPKSWLTRCYISQLSLDENSLPGGFVIRERQQASYPFGVTC